MTSKEHTSYKEVSNHIVSYASGLPLALEIFKVNFDTLEEEEKSVFLDIACCLKGYKWTEIEIYSVLFMNLSKINDEDDRVTLHDLIEDMGKEIDRQKSPKESGEAQENMVTKRYNSSSKRQFMKFEMICVDFPMSGNEERMELDENTLEMKNLKILNIKNGNFSQRPNFPESVKVLEWQRRKFMNLTVFNFDMCKCLTQIPNLSGLSNLKEPSFEYYENLITIQHFPSTNY
ncbi:Disease resistance protein RPP5 [Glycine max]|nr:Disease resistance protein RPP5 [Glycine max]